MYFCGVPLWVRFLKVYSARGRFFKVSSAPLFFLKRMKDKKKTYISGPVSGVDYEEVRTAFRAAELRLEVKGHDVVNPMRLCSSSWPWERCMRVCISAMMECDAIYMLKGWKRSRGARLEHFVALKLGMEITVEK